MARTVQDPDEVLPALDVIQVASKIPATPTKVSNRRVEALQQFVPQLQDYHGSFVKVLSAIDSSEVGKWRRAAARIPNLQVSTRAPIDGENPRLRDVWMKYDEGE